MWNMKLIITGMIIMMMMVGVLPMIRADNDFGDLPRGRFISSNNSRLPYIAISRTEEALTTIGNPISDNFFEIAKWDNQTYLRIMLPNAINNRINMVNGTVYINWSMFNGRIYMSDDDTFEWEGIFLSRPPAQLTEVTFDVEYRGMIPYYQGRLDDDYNNYTNCNATDCWNELGEIIANRPERVVGSYAWYSNDKANNEYKTGKVFHQYKNNYTDANNITIWGGINITEQVDVGEGITSAKLTFTIPIVWLRRDAAYPVILDPSFGYNITGASSITVGNSYAHVNESLILFNSPEGATVTSYNFYGESNDANPTQMSFTTYNVSGDITSAALTVQRVVFNSTSSMTLPTTPVWNSTVTNGTQLLPTGRNYTTAVQEDINNAVAYYDNLPALQRGTQLGSTNRFANPFGGSTNRARISMYTNYTINYPPTYSNNQTNSTAAGSSVNHSLTWNDTGGLSGYVFSWCIESNTTTYNIQLLNTTGILADSGVNATYPDNSNPINFAELANSSVDGRNMLYKLNISAIPDNIIIDSAILGISINNNFLDDSGEGYNVSVHHITNQTWNEDYPTWNNFNTFNYNITKEDDYYFYGGAGEPIDYVLWNITHMMNNETSQNNINLSLILKSHDSFGSPLSDYLVLNDRLNPFASRRPYVNITYTVCNMVNDTWVPFTGVANQSDVIKTITETVGEIVRWCITANDTYDFWNYSNCNNPFTYVTTSGEPAGGYDINCTCPSWNNNWQVNLTSNCLINVTCDIGLGNLTFIETGTLTINKSVNIIFNQLKTLLTNGMIINIDDNGGLIVNKTV